MLAHTTDPATARPAFALGLGCIGVLLHVALDSRREPHAVDDAVLNAGLAYVLVSAWRAFVDGEDVVMGADVHPAVETVARRLQLDPSSGDLDAGFGSCAQFFRVFRAETGSTPTAGRDDRARSGADSPRSADA